jgi:prepilin-type processing-associated H-X9-DG protein
MKAKRIEATTAFTRTELVTVITVIGLVFVFALFGLNWAKQKALRLSCRNNLRAMQSSYLIWGNDHEDGFPAVAATTNGGWSDRLLTTNAGAYCWTNYTIMAEELGQSPKVVVCPSDERIAATNFLGRGSPDDHGNADFDNTKISYFVGVQANVAHPHSILMGDRNIGSGAVPDPDYGFSPANGKGNDVVIDGPVCWSLRMHSNGKPAGAGNVLLCDGSVQQVTSRELDRNCLKAALDEAKTQAGTKSTVGIRLIFP